MEAPPSSQTVELDIEGMTCAACVGRVERVLKRVPGVTEAGVNLATNRATLALAPAAEVAALIAAVEKAGYGARVHAAPFSEDDVAEEAPVSRAVEPRHHAETLRAAVALALSLAVMALAMVPGANFRGNSELQAVLAVATVWGAGFGIQRAALRNARHVDATMDTLIALGSNAALGLSLWTMRHGGQGHHGHLYFETAAMIVAFVLLGRALEARARRHTGDALRALMALRPRRARVIRDGEEREIAVGRVRVGDRVRVLAHERLPVDGVVREGATHLDLSVLTGESMPVARAVGDDVPAGAVNGASPIVMEATRVGADTAMGQIIRLVERAQSSRAPIQRVADRAAAVFVPAVMAAAVVTYVAWRLSGDGSEHALLAAVSVLVVACPCALGLATPTAIIAGAGRAAERGILLRDAASLERAHALTDVIFDKTATLTRGVPSVTEVVALHDGDADEALAAAAALEASSEHPLARAVVELAKTRGLRAPDTREVVAVAGQGMRGIVGERRVAVGRGALVASSCTDAAREVMDDLSARGRTVALVTRDDAALAVLGLSDALREEAREAVSALAVLGVRAHLVSGDGARAVGAVAREVGIPEERVRAEVVPAGKGEVVAALKGDGRVVAMVGDGVNDAPALAAADVGFAMGSGTDVAIEAASVTLMRSDPRAVAEAIALSRRVMRVVRQNLFWAFVYNLVGIPLAATGTLERFGGPMLAAAAMAMSSVSVVSNSLRLRRA